MPVVDLSSYHQNNGTVSDGSKFNNLIDAVQTSLNGLDNNNVAAGAGIIASKLADPTAGKVLGSSGGACAAVFPPGFEIGYDQITANVTVSSTTEATGTAVISAAAHTFDGAPVMAEFCAEFVNPASAAAATIVISLFEGATQIARLAAVQNPAAAAMGAPVCARYRFTPTAASHTYSVTAFQSGGNGSIVAGAGGTATAAPAFLRFTKV